MEYTSLLQIIYRIFVGPVPLVIDLLYITLSYSVLDAYFEKTYLRFEGKVFCFLSLGVPLGIEEDSKGQLLASYIDFYIFANDFLYNNFEQ